MWSKRLVGLRGKRSSSWEDLWTGFVCLAPAFVVTTIFVVFPIGFTFYLSFHQWSILEPAKQFVGLANFRRMINSPEFGRALVVTLSYSLGTVPIGAAISLGLALLLNCKLRGLAFFRTAYFMPVVTSSVAVAIIWKWFYDPRYGLVNYLLRLMRLPTPGWLADPNWALLAIVIMSVWKNVGYYVVIFLAGLQAIPEPYYEAASLDSAGRLDKFRYITWPLLRPITGFVLITSTIFSFQAFASIYVMTGGGPMRSTTVLVYYLYERAFEFREMGYASAVAWLLFIIVFPLAVWQFRYVSRTASALGRNRSDI